jgi:hypothetical protein
MIKTLTFYDELGLYTLAKLSDLDAKRSPPREAEVAAAPEEDKGVMMAQELRDMRGSMIWNAVYTI